MNLPNDIMYNASFNKDASFEGIFWMGVKTTGIFCRPTCTARKPKDRKSTRLNSSHSRASRMPSSA